MNENEESAFLNTEQNESNKSINMNIINANARSLNNKIGSLIDIFDELQLSAAILTETWFRSGEELSRELEALKASDNIKMVARNRRGRKGGGVAVAFDSTMLNMKEFKFPNNVYELVCAVGNSSAGNRKIAIISLYIPPKQNAAAILLSLIHI